MPQVIRLVPWCFAGADSQLGEEPEPEGFLAQDDPSDRRLRETC